MEKKHFLLISLPVQGHINPTLQLARKLIGAGAPVTFATTVLGLTKLLTRPSLPGLSYASFSDGHDTPDPATPVSTSTYFQDFELVGSLNLKNLLSDLSNGGRRVDFIIYTVCLPWVAAVARELDVPSAFFFIQSAAAFSVFHHFYKSDGGFHDDIANTEIDLDGTLNLPGLPLLKYREIPNFILPTDQYYSALAPVFQQQIQTLEKDPNPCLLINTFEALEQTAIESFRKRLNVFAIGPLVSLVTENPFVCDLFQTSDRETYMQWLDSKAEKSVIYVSFGSLAKLQNKQKEEILEGLIQSGRPFLWVLRNHGDDDEEVLKGFNGGDCGGLIVRWCSQVEVLNHVAIGCFVTHGGWNSTVESMAAGVAVVGCPQFSDQMMNMKMVEDVWGNGVRAAADGERVVGREEMERCLAVVMGGGERGEEIKRNVEKWKSAAMEAVNEGGSSRSNLKKFFDMSWNPSVDD